MRRAAGAEIRVRYSDNELSHLVTLPQQGLRPLCGPVADGVLRKGFRMKTSEEMKLEQSEFRKAVERARRNYMNDGRSNDPRKPHEKN